MLTIPRRKLLTGAAVLPLFNIIKSREGSAQSPCGQFYPTIPSYVSAAGFTKLVFSDDFNVPGTIDPTGNATSGYNWFLRSGIGVTSANTVVNTAATLGGTFASPLGGVLNLTTPVAGGNGNTAIVTVPSGTSRSTILPFGMWKHAVWELQGQWNPNCSTSGQWWADWFNGQSFNHVLTTAEQNDPGGANSYQIAHHLPLTVTAGNTYPLYTELDDFEQYCGNYGFPNTQMTGGAHSWLNVSHTTQIDGGGGGYVHNTSGFPSVVPDGNPHKYSVVWGTTSTSGVGFIQWFIDEVPQYLYNNGNPTSSFPTGPGAAPGFEYMEQAGPWFWQLGGPPGFSFLIDYVRVWQ